MQYPFDINDRVRHISDVVEGTILSIDKNIPHPTTCTVQWDDVNEIDIQWTNKLIKV